MRKCLISNSLRQFAALSITVKRHFSHACFLGVYGFRQKKDQTMGTVEAHVVPFLTQNEGSTQEYTESDPSKGVAQKASQYTAIKGEIGQNEVESTTHTDSTQPYGITSLKSRKRQGKESFGNLQNPTSGGQGSRTLNRLPGN